MKELKNERMKQFSFEQLYMSYVEQRPTGQWVIDETLRVIATHNMLYPQEVALVMDVNVKELRAAFHLLTGLTLIDVITQWRYRQARAMIGQGGLTLQQVARRCGWRSLRSMDEVFLRLGGESARHYYRLTRHVP